MKNIFLTLSIFLLLTNCSEQHITREENPIYNKWSLVRFEPGLSPTETFNEGKIEWLFQQSNKLKVDIDNSISTSPIKPNGEYVFSLNRNSISIDNIEYDYSINENTLIISDDLSSDGFKATFIIGTD